MKILIMSGYTPSLFNFRGDLIKHMLQYGHEVIATGPEPDIQNEICGLGARFIQLPLDRAGYNPVKDMMTMFQLFKLLTAEKPDIVLGYTIKPVIYGSIVSRFAGVKRVFSMVTGFGYVFLAKGLKGVFIRAISKALYFLALKSSNKVFFQNPDDIAEFIQMGLIKKEKCVLIHGSGINTENFKPVPLPDRPVFLMICRIIRDKGVIEFLEAARKVKKSGIDAHFQLLGPFDPNPAALKFEDIKPYIDEETVEYFGETKDVRPYIANCWVYVLPSYREGTPRTVLEAMAMGRPIITTDAPGCKETVVEKVNGFLVPVKNVNVLAERILWMIANRKETFKMGKESRRICCEKYDVHNVNSTILNELGLLYAEEEVMNAG